MSKGIREAPTKALMGELAAKSDDRPEQAFGARTATTLPIPCLRMPARRGMLFVCRMHLSDVPQRGLCVKLGHCGQLPLAVYVDL